MATPSTTADYRVYDEWDNGEFLTGATVDLTIDGEVVHTEKFVVSDEDYGYEGSAAYGRGARGHALSYANAWVESQTTTLEERLAPFGPEWQREQDERRGW